MAKKYRVETANARERVVKKLGLLETQEYLKERQSKNDFVYIDGNYVDATKVTAEQIDQAGAIKTGPKVGGG